MSDKSVAATTAEPTKPAEERAGSSDRDVNVVELLWKHCDEVVAAICAAFILIVSLRRLRYGVDFTDEAFYAAITQRYALGDWPYLDEYNLRQTASLVAVPFYWAYMKVMGGTDGVVLLLRAVYFGIQVATGWTVYRFAVVRIPRSFALVAATLPVVFLPFQIPTCSYNTLGAMFFAAGTFAGLRALLDERTPRAFFIAGLLHGLACIGYPPMAIPVTLSVVAASVLLYRSDALAAGEWRWLVLRYVLGLAAVAFVLGLLLIPGLTHHGVSEAIRYEHQTTIARSSDKAKEVLRAVVDLAPGGPHGWLGLLGALGLAAKQYPHLRKPLFALFVLYFAWFFQDAQPQYLLYLNSLYLSVYLGLFAGFFLLFVDWRKEGATMLVAGWAPAVVAGFITAFATANGGCVNGGIGLFAAACLAMVALPMVTDMARVEPIRRAVGVIVLAAIPLTTLSVNMTTTYRAGPIDTNTAKVTTGPYRWMRSAPDRVKQAHEMTQALRAALAESPSERILAYYDLSAPYLVAPVRPAMPTVCTDRRAQLQLLLPYYAAHRTGNGLVFHITGSPNVSPQLEHLVEDRTRMVGDYGWFKIYREPPP